MLDGMTLGGGGLDSSLVHLEFWSGFIAGGICIAWIYGIVCEVFFTGWNALSVSVFVSVSVSDSDRMFIPYIVYAVRFS